MGRNGKLTRRTVLATIGAGAGTGIVSGRGSPDVDETGPVEFVDVVWTIDDLGTPEVEVTIRNNSDEELSIDVTVRLFEDDVLLDDVDLLFSDVPVDTETSEARSLIGAEQEDFGRVTHWTVEIEEFDLLNGDATVYEFDGPVVPDEEIDVEDADVVEEE